MARLPLFLSLFFLTIKSCNTLSPIQYPILRRSGSFPAPEIANLSYLLSQLQEVESRFNATVLSHSSSSSSSSSASFPESNDALIRMPRRLHGTQSESILLGSAGREGNWFATLEIGTPTQTVDMDLDMLSADWWILSTRSGTGSFFLDFHSKTYVDNSEAKPFPTCRLPRDVVHLPMEGEGQTGREAREVEISFAHCRPVKQWVRSLLPSGAYLGLAPGKGLSQTKTKGFLGQLLEMDVIDEPVFSIWLRDAQHGVFTVGGVREREAIGAEKDEDKFEYQNKIAHEEVKRDNTNNPDNEKDWKWMKVHNNEGWWTLLMDGLWVNNANILQNQEVILDLNTPFLVAPPHAAQKFYASIFGSRRLLPPYDQFHAYPCFSPPKIYFDFEGWKVKVWKGKRDAGTFSPGGRFSLGRMGPGSGYCIGILVESRFMTSVRQDHDPYWERDNEEGHGLDDVWIVGEGFFADVHVVFDWKESIIGMQRFDSAGKSDSK